MTLLFVTVHLDIVPLETVLALSALPIPTLLEGLQILLLPRALLVRPAKFQMLVPHRAAIAPMAKSRLARCVAVVQLAKKLVLLVLEHMQHAKRVLLAITTPLAPMAASLICASVVKMARKRMRERRCALTAHRARSQFGTP